jgi:tRNA threonylcarbamoyladenosine biosynthesis protein TsaB
MRASHILALDTTTTMGSVAICRNGNLVVERHWTALESHSTKLLQEIDAAMRRSGSTWNDLTHLAAISGPGSFTGIRIGLGTIQGLAHASGKPILGITALETLAFAASTIEGPICAVIDARRNQVFHQLFDNRGVAVPRSSQLPQCDDRADWLRSLARLPGVCCVGSGAMLCRSEIEKLGSSYGIFPEVERLAGFAAQIAAWRISTGIDCGNPFIEALYVRPPDVFLAAAKKQP